MILWIGFISQHYIDRPRIALVEHLISRFLTDANFIEFSHRPRQIANKRQKISMPNAGINIKIISTWLINI